MLESACCCSSYFWGLKTSGMRVTRTCREILEIFHPFKWCSFYFKNTYNFLCHILIECQQKKTHLENSGEKGMNRVKYFIRTVEEENVDTHKLSFFENFISGIYEEFTGWFLRDEEMLYCELGIFQEYFWINY